MATQLLESYRERAFEISMPDAPSYELMRKTFADLGRQTGPDGEFFVIKVFPVLTGDQTLSINGTTDATTNFPT